MKIQGLKCPYCDHSNNHVYYNLETYEGRTQVVCCDMDSGGCDKDFVVIFDYPNVTKQIFKIHPAGG